MIIAGPVGTVTGQSRRAWHRGSGPRASKTNSTWDDAREFHHPAHVVHPLSACHAPSCLRSSREERPVSPKMNSMLSGFLPASDTDQFRMFALSPPSCEFSRVILYRVNLKPTPSPMMLSKMTGSSSASPRKLPTRHEMTCCFGRVSASGGTGARTTLELPCFKGSWANAPAPPTISVRATAAATVVTERRRRGAIRRCVSSSWNALINRPVVVMVARSQECHARVSLTSTGAGPCDLLPLRATSPWWAPAHCVSLEDHGECSRVGGSTVDVSQRGIEVSGISGKVRGRGRGDKYSVVV